MRQRRDPRSERLARLLPGTRRPRFTLAPAAQPASTRPRRDPRALRRAATVVAGARPRIDWQAGRGGGGGPVAGEEAAAVGLAAAPSMRVIVEPAFLVLAVPDCPSGALSEHDRELIGAARQLADAGGGAVVALAWGEAAGLASAGADRAMTFAAGDGKAYDPEGRAAAVLAAIEALKPKHVLFAESADGGADLARRVAALAGARLFAGVEVLGHGRVFRRMRGGAMEQTASAPALMSVAAGAFAPHDGARHEARALEAPQFTAPRRIDKAEPLQVEATSLALSDADFILSGGNGVTDWAAFAELGRVLGATLGGSRVVCDEGHLPRDRQVGASGAVVTARCYLAFGIAGAPQHLQGIAEVKHVVAINTDLHAEMIKRADLAIIADAQAVMPALIRHARSVSAADGTTDLPFPLEGEGSRRRRVGEGDDLSPNAEFVESPSPGHRFAAPVLSWVASLYGERQALAVGRGQAAPVERPGPPASRTSRPKTRDDRDPQGCAASAATVRVAVLLSVGRHPASGRARRAPLDGRALEMALGLAGAEIHAIHAGDPDEPALRDYLGMGPERLSVLAVPPGSDPIPALAAHLARLRPEVILCGNRAESGEDSGSAPYLLAQTLGCAVAADVTAVAVEAGRASLTQALPRGKRRLVETGLPVVAAVSAAAPAPRQSAFARSRRGSIEPLAAEAPADAFLAACDIRPWRPRPKRMALARGGSASDRLRAMTETKAGEGVAMIHPSPEDAARAIYDYLLAKRIIGAGL